MEIWQNFIERLEKLSEEHIDFDDLKDHLEQLAQNKMNGRQICNAIKTARQCAKWKKESLNYDFVQDIIRTAERLYLYFEKLNGVIPRISRLKMKTCGWRGQLEARTVPSCLTWNVFSALSLTHSLLLLPCLLFTSYFIWRIFIFPACSTCGSDESMDENGPALSPGTLEDGMRSPQIQLLSKISPA